MASLQKIADEDRDVFAVGLVRRGSATPKIIVIHRREIVVNEAESVDAFHRDRRREGLDPIATDGFTGSQDEHRPEAFTTAQQGIARGFIQQGCQTHSIDRGGE